MERRIAALEAAEWDRIHALPPREWIRCGHVSFESLPLDERDELTAILETAFDDRGYLNHRHLTPEQQARGVELIRKMGEHRTLNYAKRLERHN